MISMGSFTCHVIDTFESVGDLTWSLILWGARLTCDIDWPVDLDWHVDIDWPVDVDGTVDLDWTVNLDWPVDILNTSKSVLATVRSTQVHIPLKASQMALEEVFINTPTILLSTIQSKYKLSFCPLYLSGWWSPWWRSELCSALLLPYLICKYSKITWFQLCTRWTEGHRFSSAVGAISSVTLISASPLVTNTLWISEKLWVTARPMNSAHVTASSWDMKWSPRRRERQSSNLCFNWLAFDFDSDQLIGG